MRSLAGSPVRRSGAGVALFVALFAAGPTGCEFITGVPDVGYVEVSVSPPEFPAGTNSRATAAARKNGGGLITHNRRRPAFSSSDNAIATVSSDGVVFGVAKGTAWIIAESGGKKDSARVTVTPPIPAQIDLSPTFPTTFVNDTTRVTVTPRTSSGTAITDFTVACSTSNGTVATVVVTGNTCLLRGIAPGSTTLLVSVNGVDKSVSVTVAQAKIERITANIRKPIRVGEDVPVDVQLFGTANAPLPLTGRALAFESSNPTVATVNSQSGVVRAVSAGTATITVTTEGNLKATTEVVVTQLPIVTVRIAPRNAQFRIGQTGAMAIAAFDSLNRDVSLAGRTRSFRSLDESVLRIAQSGVVTTIKIGTTRVIGEVDGIADTTDVRVTEIPTGRVVIDSVQVTRSPGGTFQYTATVFDSLGAVVTGRPIRWTSNSLAVEINQVTGLARALGSGVATISAEVARVAGLPDVVVGQASFVVRQTPAAKVVVAPATLTLKVGATGFVGVTVLDAQDRIIFGREASVRPVYSTAGIAFINPATGQVNAVAEGTTTITLQVLDQFGQPEGQTATLTVTVTPQ
jgi:uncharacterized protein YjdB